MKKRKSQELGTAEREQIAQEFMFKINQAAEDDEESVQNQSPAIYKLKMLPVCDASYVCMRVKSIVTCVPRMRSLGNPEFARASSRVRMHGKSPPCLKSHFSHRPPPRRVPGAVRALSVQLPTPGAVPSRKIVGSYIHTDVCCCLRAPSRAFAVLLPSCFLPTLRLSRQLWPRRSCRKHSWNSISWVS